MVCLKGSMRRLLTCLMLAVMLACAACNSPKGGDLSEADSAYTDGNYYQAQRLYEHYLEAHPQGKGRWEAWNRLLDISALVENNQAKAAQLLEAMLLESAENPQRVGALRLRLASTYMEMNQWDKALEVWQSLLGDEHSPMPQWEVQWNMGKVYQFQGKYSHAREAMTRARDMAQDGADKARCTYDLALANSFLGQRDQARQWLEVVMSEPKATPELKAMAGYLLSEILELQGRKDKAREILESIKDTYPNPMAVKLRLKRLAQ